MKVLQALYAFIFSENDNLIKGEKELMDSLEKTKELFLWQISIAFELSDIMSQKLEDRQRKFLPTQEDLNPNYKFVDNKLIALWRKNTDIQRLIRNYKVSWIENSEVFRRLANDFENSDVYKQYLDAKDSFKNDKSIMISLYTDFIYEDDFFIDFYETKSVYWHTDFCMMNFMMKKFIEDYKESYDESTSLQEIFRENEEISSNEKEDKDFVTSLFSRTIIHRNEYTDLANKFTKNWDADRISAMDMLIITMAITEMLHFPSIPVRVTMNEYIDISKIFSTPKSKTFINGVLDSVYKDLSENGKITKTGRGLVSK